MLLITIAGTSLIMVEICPYIMLKCVINACFKKQFYDKSDILWRNKMKVTDLSVVGQYFSPCGCDNLRNFSSILFKDLCKSHYVAKR